jgi:hypothetical protein
MVRWVPVRDDGPLCPVHLGKISKFSRCGYQKETLSVVASDT